MLEEKVRELGPWRHDIDCGDFSTFDVAESVGPFSHIGHPENRLACILEHIPDPPATVLDIGCNAGGISFGLEEEGYTVTGIDKQDDKDSYSRPLEQAMLCKSIKQSDVEFIQSGAIEHLRTCNTYDVIVAAGILYHIQSNGHRNTEAEKEFLSLALQKSSYIVIETDPTPWLTDFLEKEGCTVKYGAEPNNSPHGVRQFVSVECS